MKNSNHVMKKEKFGTQNLELFQQAMRNAELTPVGFSCALTKKFTVFLDSKTMKLIKCYG